jgi:hypothetical protein
MIAYQLSAHPGAAGCAQICVHRSWYRTAGDSAGYAGVANPASKYGTTWLEVAGYRKISLLLTVITRKKTKVKSTRPCHPCVT